METLVRRAGDPSRYELLVDGEVVGFTEYHRDGDALVFPHTLIDPDHRGRGLGRTLVRGAMDDVRRRGERVVPTCWFVRAFLDANPDYTDLRPA